MAKLSFADLPKSKYTSLLFKLLVKIKRSEFFAGNDVTKELIFLKLFIGRSYHGRISTLKVPYSKFEN